MRMHRSGRPECSPTSSRRLNCLDTEQALNKLLPPCHRRLFQHLTRPSLTQQSFASHVYFFCFAKTLDDSTRLASNCNLRHGAAVVQSLLTLSSDETVPRAKTGTDTSLETWSREYASAPAAQRQVLRPQRGLFVVGASPAPVMINQVMMDVDLLSQFDA
ncbi:uncharacterized protein J3D65DRAFT_355413 [Phyllosticta citribraziliensis]|uniref:Uncharacterized protein n=1 Tax=Phyllosticta citribraziliensis TaxID=989973 RepID=A0ABR1LQ25_9PEZI